MHKVLIMIAKQREQSWDFVKFVLMFLIVFGHFCPAGELWTPVTRIVGLCAIPGFFFVSGYFQSQVKDWSSLLRKMQRLFMRIVLPMLSWGTIYVLVSFFQMVFRGDMTDANGLYQFFKYFPIYIMGIYWFFTALIFCVIVGSLLSWFMEKNKFMGFFLLLVSPILFCVISPSFFEHYHFSFVWLFYSVGILYKHVADKYSSTNNIWDIMFVVLFIIVVIIGVGYEPQKTFYYESNLIRYSSVSFVTSRYVLYLLATTSVIYCLMRFYRFFKENRIVNRLASFGADTLFIYCSHVLVLVFLYRPFLLPYLFHEQGGWSVRFLEHIVGLIVSVLMYYLMQNLCLYCKQFRWLRVFLMGIK